MTGLAFVVIAALIVYGLVITGLYLSERHDLKLAVEQSSTDRRNFRVAIADRDEARLENYRLNNQLKALAATAGRYAKERDAYRTGLNWITAMQTKSMANIGRKMAGAAHAALNAGRNV